MKSRTMASDPNKRRPGRPSHQPTGETRELVIRLVVSGKSVSAIAEALTLSEPTVRAHYARELASPKPQINFPFPGSDDPKPKRAAPVRAGRPGHVATVETREQVEILVAGGMRQWQIAAALRISEPTLREHYPEELDGGRARRDAVVIEALFRAAASGNVSAQKAWLSNKTDLEEPPPMRVEPLGKKAAAHEAAFTAGHGTGWEGLLPN
jgi:DNA-binding CsgD family transcriptional regulator